MSNPNEKLPVEEANKEGSDVSGVDEQFRAHPLYKTEIEPFLEKETSLADKLVFALRYSLTKIPSGRASYPYSESGFGYDGKLGQQVLEQYRSTIKTSQDLDSFLNELTSKLSLSKQGGYDHYPHVSNLGDESYANHSDAFNQLGRVISPIVNEIKSSHFNYPLNGKWENFSVSDEDMDWAYTLGKYFYTHSVPATYVLKIYYKTMDNPRSIAFRNELISTGVDMDKMDRLFKSEYSK